MGMRTRTFVQNQPGFEITYNGNYQFIHPHFGADPIQYYSAGPAFGGPGFSNTIIDDITWKRVNGHYLNGGPFSLRRVYEKSQRTPVNGSGTGYPNWQISGYMYPVWYGNVPDLPGIPESGLDACSAYGADGWNKFNPLKPDADLGVFLAELRDLPSMLKHRSYFHANPGGHYLMYQFGWKPFFSDLMKMIDLVGQLDSKIANLVQMNGKPVRKKGTVRNSSSVVSTWSVDEGYHVVFQPMPHFTAEQFESYGCSGSHVTGEKVWFSATFRYHIPKLPSMIMDRAGIRRMKAHMMGLNLKPSTVWAAMPWSWLIDYFGNVGSVLSNMSLGSLGDVVSTDAYIMRHAWDTYRQESWCTLKDNSFCKGLIERTAETKCRSIADPFGFGLSTDLSGRQLAILSALGISRL